MLVAEVGTLEILRELDNTKEFLRFHELRKRCKIPQNTLVRRLKQLEEYKLIERKLNLDRTVDYKITQKGKEVYQLLLRINKLIMHS